jgi:hypothetical protein
VATALQAAEQVKGGALAEAEARIQAGEQVASEKVASAQAQAAAAEAMAEARVRDAEAARTAAVALVMSLQVGRVRPAAEGQAARRYWPSLVSPRGQRSAAGPPDLRHPLCSAPDMRPAGGACQRKITVGCSAR